MYKDRGQLAVMTKNINQQSFPFSAILGRGWREAVYFSFFSYLFLSSHVPGWGRPMEDLMMRPHP